MPWSTPVRCGASFRRMSSSDWGLARVGQRVAEYADGRLGAVDLSEPFTLTVMGREELEDAIVLGDEVIIGQTALEKLDFVVDCAGQRLAPNPAHPDQPVSKIK